MSLNATTPTLTVDLLQHFAHQHGTRTLSNILWGSLMTIFACTWVSCHPNISFDEDKSKIIRDLEEDSYRCEHDKNSQKWWKRLWPSLTSIKVIFIALITPEFIVMWAFRQYMAAKSIVEKYGDLTMTHAFFSLMGGFVILDKEHNPTSILRLHPNMNLGLRHRLLDVVNISVEALVEALFDKAMETTLTVDEIVDEVMGVVNNVAVVDAVVDAVADEAILHVFMAAYGNMGASLPSLETVSVEKTNLAVDVLVGTITEALVEVLVEVLAMGRENPNLQNKALQSEGLFFVFRNSLAAKVGDMKLHADIRNSFMEKLRVRLRGGGLRDTLEILVYCREEEIQDRSKPNWLVKALALTQSVWFVVQCVARKAQHLPLTKIELMTCAYVVLSTATYVFWWNKPFRVDYPMLVHSNMNIPHKWRNLDTSTSQSNSRRMDVITLAKFLHGSLYNEISFSRRLQVPTFYSGFFLKTTRGIWTYLAGVLTAAVFGGIHLFAWKYEFPSRMELWLWRLSALVIVGAPPIIFIPVSILIRNKAKQHFYFRLSKMILPSLVLLYVIARLVILVLAMISLKTLSPRALTDVEWLKFVPYIS
ncbi:hypothetical protein Clacol_001018 [Clathrus columnatus]|uniref:Uncharacterized protein n=1 Tax=Clathrus columnatus TaxID=1419009 RepID=A0AAV5A0A5_9AGAM|nr:hypothetical protein Clacol_001018 [Clathrus columnatus]